MSDEDAHTRLLMLAALLVAVLSVLCGYAAYWWAIVYNPLVLHR